MILKLLKTCLPLNYLRKNKLQHGSVSVDAFTTKSNEQDKDTLTSKIAHGKKEIKICEDIEKRVPDMKEKLKQIQELEDERNQQQIEYERSFNL